MNLEFFRFVRCTPQFDEILDVHHVLFFLMHPNIQGYHISTVPKSSLKSQMERCLFKATVFKTLCRSIYSGCLIGIPIMDYDNPQITG